MEQLIDKRTIQIGFGKSSSANYDYAIELIEQFTNHEQKDNMYIAQLGNDNIDLFFELFEVVKGWKSSFILIDGKKIPMNKIKNGLQCFQQRCKAYNPVEYCFGIDSNDSFNVNLFGCRHCGFSNSYYYNAWYSVGELDNKGTFHIDKDRLEHEIKNNIEQYSICPALNLDDILNTLHKLPNIINPKKDVHFEYYTDWDEDTGDEIITGIMLKKKYVKNYKITTKKSASLSSPSSNSSTPSNSIELEKDTVEKSASTASAYEDNFKRNDSFNKTHGKKNLLDHIPGFRSRKVWKMIIAVPYYLVAISALLSGENIGSAFVGLAIPFVVFYIIDKLKNK